MQQCEHTPVLIILSGHSGVGKTTIGREVVRRLRGVYIRIDSIETALRRDGIDDIRDEGYRVGYAIAVENLRLGMLVVADSVNPWSLTRDAWHDAARQACARFIDVEVICSDAIEHQRRVEARVPDIAGHVLPTWLEVMNRDYRAWDSARLVIDTAIATVDESVERVIRAVQAL